MQEIRKFDKNTESLLTDYKNYLPLDRIKEAYTLIKKNDEFFYFIVMAYNSYKLLNGGDYFSLIINPEQLFCNQEAETEFIDTIKRFVTEVIEEQEEE